MKSKNDSDRVNYKEQCKFVNKLILDTKTNFYNGKIESAQGDQKELFKVINNVFHNRPEQPLPSHNSIDELTNAFSNFYVTKIEKIRTEIITAETHSNCNNIDILLDSEYCQVRKPLSDFVPASEDEIRNIIAKSPSKSCILDPIPTWLLKKCGDSVIPLITAIVNMSLMSSQMPSELKKAILIPIIKKIILDPEVLNNFRPISNLPFISKIIEKVVALRVNEHLLVVQSGLHYAMQKVWFLFWRVPINQDNRLDDINHSQGCFCYKQTRV